MAALSKDPAIQTSKFELTTRDGNNFVIDFAVIKESTLLSNACSFEGSSDEPIKFPLSEVSSSIIPVVIEFCKHFKDLPPYLPLSNIEASNSQLSDDEYEMKCLSKLSSQQLKEFICAANYLDMPRLVDAACYQLNSKIRGKSLDEMRNFFNMQAGGNYGDQIREHVSYSKLGKIGVNGSD